MSREALEMVSLAKRYCALIDASGTENSNWLKQVALLLPKLHAAVSALNGLPYDAVQALSPDLEARFELYTHLVDLLGDRDSYWHEFDRMGDSHTMTGSLADDLTDIYCELKHCLHMVDRNPEGSLCAWQQGFAGHWGQHLCDAQRHLAELAARGILE